MNIAINTRNLIHGKMEGFGRYTFELCKRIVNNHPEHTFYFFFDRKYNEQFIFGENVIPVVIDPPARHPILWYVWFELRIGKALKKYKIDIFWSPDGFINLRTEVPQIATIHDINFHVYPKDLPKSVSYYYNRFFPKFSQKAKRILTVSNFSKEELIKYYQIEKSKISVIHNSADEIFKPMDEKDIISTRNEISEGRPYFLFVGSLHPRKNIQRLLDAFAIFASENKEIDLVIVGSPLWKKNRILMPFEVQNRIHFTGYLKQEKLAKITGAAYVLSYLPYYEGFGIPMVEAMKCGVPILAANASCLPEIAGDAAVYSDPFDIEDIAKKMSEFSKKEFRETIAKKAMRRANEFSWDKAAKDVWNEIEKIKGQNNL